MEEGPDFWHLAGVLLPAPQVARLHRMDQGFEVVAICTQDPLHVIMTGSCGYLRPTYDLIYTKGRLRCTCPDAEQCPELRCKHQCWMIVRMGRGGIAALQGDEEELGEAMKTAGATLALQLWKEATKHVAEEARLGEDCPICFERLNTGATCCKCPDCKGHFHFSCIARWLWRFPTPRCPLCRGTDWKDL